MLFDAPLKEATLIKRYKRFLADVTLKDGQSATLFCPNTGSLKGCNQPASKIWYSESSQTTRKYPYTWELIQVEDALVGINTHRANDLVEEAISSKRIAPLLEYSALRREVRFGKEKSRIDFLLNQDDRECYVEVKNVTLSEKDVAYFPDAVTLRGTKHLRELMHVKEMGHRAVLFFCVQHTHVNSVRPAEDIDPLYAKTLREAYASGVEIIAYRANISPEEIILDTPLEVVL